MIRIHDHKNNAWRKEEDVEGEAKWEWWQNMRIINHTSRWFSMKDLIEYSHVQTHLITYS